MWIKLCLAMFAHKRVAEIYNRSYCSYSQVPTTIPSLNSSLVVISDNKGARIVIFLKMKMSVIRF